MIATFYSVQEIHDEEARIPHGPIDVTCSCPLLEPGQECPFSIEMYARDYVAYHLHPEGRPVDYRQPVSLALSGLNLSNDGAGNVRITGTATNESAFTVQNAAVTGTLLDANGQIVSTGSTLVLGEIPPDGSLPFDLRIAYELYSSYQLYAQAIQS